MPLVYVCEAASDAEAAEIHRFVWNQNVAPFLLMSTPTHFRLYRGFRYDTPDATGAGPQDQSLVSVVSDAADVLDKFADFKAQAIDQGTLWRRWSQTVSPETRVDWKLLENLKLLGQWLRNHDLPKETAHAIIGQYVYLSYLRDRGILSPRRLDDWGIKQESVFGPNASRHGLFSVVDRLADWLNGSIFPIPKSGKASPDQEHVRKVAGTFSGDEPLTGQMHLDFQAYDFQHIPIETLSVVYEQFLHSEGQGKGLGAYYTPIHLVNFILDELDAKHPLKTGMKVFDPACGSGAFLVQCYRRLIERKVAASPSRRLRPSDLRELLTSSIFGLDVDADACSVTELSLVMTLLDYVRPPDLMGSPNFKLPTLRDRNIVHLPGGLFDPELGTPPTEPLARFDWVVGNPPWKRLHKNLTPSDKHALTWMGKNASRCPTGDKQLAEAFAWKAADFTTGNGVVGLLLPAMLLFKSSKTAKLMRQQFFKRNRVWCIANFANLAEVLFAGRSRLPAAALFYTGLGEGEERDGQETVLTYSPMVVNQIANCPPEAHSRQDTWSIAVNRAEVREVPVADAATGDGLPWKLAMWGTARDKHVLDSLASQFPTFADFAAAKNILVHEGPQLRTRDGEEAVKPAPEVIGQNRILMQALKECGRIYAFPKEALDTVPSDWAYIRTRGGAAPLRICRPPHVVVDCARRFAVFSNSFVVVPHGQLGISSTQENEVMLRALSLFLCSDFAQYHQFFMSAQWGVQKSTTTLDTLLTLPVPFDGQSEKEVSELAKLQRALVAEEQFRRSQCSGQPLLAQNQRPDRMRELEHEVNVMVFSLLGLSKAEQVLVHDLLNVRMDLNQGKVAEAATQPASEAEIRAYAKTLKKELDVFVGATSQQQHRVTVGYAERLGVVRVEYLEGRAAALASEIDVQSGVDKGLSNVYRSLLQQHRQWLYFERGLRVYDGKATYLFKPRERLHWLKSQAYVDADEFIADKLVTAKG